MGQVRGERFQNLLNSIPVKNETAQQRNRAWLKLRFTPHSARCRAAAFTLVELMVGVLIFSIAVAALCLTISFSVATTRSAQENLRASQIMVEKMEYMRLYNWAQITNDAAIPKTFTAVFNPSSTDSPNGNGNMVYHGQISINPVWFNSNCATNMRLVTVTLNWTSKRPQARRMQTFVARNGLQQYVY